MNTGKNIQAYLVYRNLKTSKGKQPRTMFVFKKTPIVFNRCEMSDALYNLIQYGNTII